ncbi:putative guanine nucleotide exchange factor synembryn [Lyophyllum shimeji]|uniref:Guanine nucleotide exchange factor synembryn n=1 Tax=Lyophyllum shimeji TaxID=47721 RepID=A0A9P3PSP4_LYOSH|nr:putative guanine nucleotide exchange factor synembryn [Lyophyllum shimeji]
MTDILQSYAALSASSSSSDVSAVLQSIIDTSSSAVDASTRTELLKCLLRDLKALSNGSVSSTLSSDDAAQALLALKMLGRSPAGSEYLASPANLSTLLALSSSFKDDPVASSEALRCVANALVLIEEARTPFLEKEVDGGTFAISTLEETSLPDHIFVLSRILHRCIVSGPPFVRTMVESKWNGRSLVEIIGTKINTLTDEVLAGTRMAREALCDLLKLTSVIAIHYPKMVEAEPQHSKDADPNERIVLGDCWSHKLDGLLPPTLRAFMSLPPTSPSPIAIPLTNAIHALITIPINPELRPVWFGTSNTTPTPVVQRACDLLDASFSHYFPGAIDVDDESVRDRCKAESPDDRIDDLLLPLVALLTKFCIADEASRVHVRQWIVPDNLDRTVPLEGRADILGRCLRLLGSVYHPGLKAAVGEMLFAMCDSDAANLSSLVGYGNVAGFLFHKGVLNAPATTTNSTFNPSTSDTPINPITGMKQEPKQSLDMTDEEKAQEMEKLFVLFDRMEKTGAISPDQNPMRTVIQKATFGG